MNCNICSLYLWTIEPEEVTKIPCLDTRKTSEHQSDKVTRKTCKHQVIRSLIHLLIHSISNIYEHPIGAKKCPKNWGDIEVNTVIKNPEGAEAGVCVGNKHA